MSFFFTESQNLQMQESPCFQRRGSDVQVTRSVQFVASFNVGGGRWGIGGPGAYGDTTPANWNETATGSGTFLKSYPAFARRVVTFTCTPDPYSLTDYSESQTAYEYSGYTGEAVEETSFYGTHGSGEGTSYGSPYYPTSLTESVVWTAGDATRTASGTRTVAMYAYDFGSGTEYHWESSIGGTPGEYYDDVEFTYERVAEWTLDYLWSELVTDIQSLWSDIVAEVDFNTAATSWRSYDADGNILTTAAISGGIIPKSDAPGTFTVAGVGAGNNGITIFASRYSVAGDPATYVAEYTDNDPPTGVPASVDTKTSTLLPVGSNDYVFQPTAGQVSNLSSLKGLDYRLGWPENYTDPTPDWPAPT